MKIKTANLIGPALDWAVAIALGKTPVAVKKKYSDGLLLYDRPNATIPLEYSTKWSQGGPIIEEAGIGTSKHFADWAQQWHWCGKLGGLIHHGPTPLIAAMRCFVASHLGDEIEIPDELIQTGA